MMINDVEHETSNEGSNNPPVLARETTHSSVSTRLQEEYTELLKYAVGQPNPSSRIMDFSGHSFRPVGMCGGSSSRQTPVDQQQEIGEGDVNTNSIYSTQLPKFGSFSMQTVTDSPTDTNTNKKHAAKKETKKSDDTDEATCSCSQSTVVDPVISEMSCKLDSWLEKLKCDISVELGKSILQSLDCQKQSHHRETQEIIREKQRLEKEINRLNELVNTCEVSMCRKDTLLENLSQALAKEKNKVCMAQAFYQCKATLADSKREKFTCQLAIQHHDRQLCQKVLKSWFGLIQKRWKKRLEKICQDQAQGVCKQLNCDYEDKVKSLNNEVENLRNKVVFLQQEREQYAEQVKKAFMRGVCALNMEAMSAFSGEEVSTEPDDAKDSSNCNVNINNNLESSHPLKNDQPPKSLPTEFVTTVPDLYSKESKHHSLQTVEIGQPQRSKSQQSKVKGRSSAPSGSPSPRQLSKSFVTLGYSGPLAPPMASIVVERHNPITKQTVGKATASRFPKPGSSEGIGGQSMQGGGAPVSRSQPTAASSSSSSSQQTFKLLAGQTVPPPSSPGVKVVE